MFLMYDITKFLYTFPFCRDQVTLTYLKRMLKKYFKNMLKYNQKNCFSNKIELF